MPKLGHKNGQLTECPNSPNCVSSQATDKGHAITALNFAGTVSEAKAKLIEIIQQEKRTRIVTNNEDYIHAEFVSLIFRFVDDIEFYLHQDSPQQTTIDVRSASRVGRSDLGVNRKRVEMFRERLKN